jgi:two-component system cell cycle sensor histidine kinase PleC
VFNVTDTGVGIAPKDISKALEAFGQIDNSLSRQHQGVGLGLPLAKKLIEMHRGRLEVRSEPGRGTQITITMPPARTASVPLEMEAERRLSGS